MYNVKVITSGDRVEIYKVSNYLINESKEDPGHKIIKELLENIEDKQQEGEENKQTKQDRIKTLTKARNNIIRLIRCNTDMQTFITLTFAKELDYKESKTKLNIFFTKLRKRYKQLKYLWVLEYGDKNKRLHYHVLCNIPIEINLSSSREEKTEDHKKLEQNFNKAYWNNGFVDIRHLGKEDNSNIALYVSTYIVKSLQDTELEGYRIYGYSHRTLNKPIEDKFYSIDKIDVILNKYKDYKVCYTSSYAIGYTNWKGNHEGNVTYIDLIKK